MREGLWVWLKGGECEEKKEEEDVEGRQDVGENVVRRG